MKQVLCVAALICALSVAFAAKPKVNKKKNAAMKAELTALPAGMLASHGFLLDVEDAGGEHQSGHSSQTDFAGNIKVKNTMRRNKEISISVRNNNADEQEVSLQWF